MDQISVRPVSSTVTGSQSGFTLIEVLIAITLLSLLMLSGMMGYDFMQQNWQRSQSKQQQNLQHYHQWQLLYDVLTNTYPKLVMQKSIQNQPESGGSVGFYFLGRVNGFTAVSSTSIQNPASAAVYRLFKEPDPETPGLWQLVYEEALLSMVLLAYADQELPFAFRRVLLTGQHQVKFSYQGWASLQQKLQSQDDLAEVVAEMPWQDEYDGMQTLLQPTQIQVQSDSWQWQQQFELTGNEQLAQLDTGT